MELVHALGHDGNGDDDDDNDDTFFLTHLAETDLCRGHDVDTAGTRIAIATNIATATTTARAEVVRQEEADHEGDDDDDEDSTDSEADWIRADVVEWYVARWNLSLGALECSLAVPATATATATALTVEVS